MTDRITILASTVASLRRLSFAREWCSSAIETLGDQDTLPALIASYREMDVGTLPPAVASALASVRSQLDRYPSAQLDAALDAVQAEIAAGLAVVADLTGIRFGLENLDPDVLMALEVT